MNIIIKYILHLLLILVFFTSPDKTYAQVHVVRDIKSFGAIGDGRTNDHEAFERAAAFFNARGGNGTLSISPGTYLVGKQTFNSDKIKRAPAYRGWHLLALKKCSNLKISGTKNTKIRYKDGLKYGSYNPETGLPHSQKTGRFINTAYAATVGFCINLEDCQNVEITNLELDGNSSNAELGGVYGDHGRQLPYFGIFIRNSQDIVVDDVHVHHFGQDGICVGNKELPGKDNIRITNSRFEYNSRQGLSWTGGNSLFVKNCKFNHTGRGAFSSSPGAGIDIEAERGVISNGVFENCEAINNRGCGMVADSGPSSNCSFTNCTFWGVTTWSVWVNKPGFIFKNCNLYGSFVHGYDAKTDAEATRFIKCNFEDKLYNGKQPKGKFLVESNHKRRVSFSDCNFTSNSARLLWLQQKAGTLPEEKYQFNNCKFIINNDTLKPKSFVAVIRGIRYKNCTFTYTSPRAKEKKYYLNSCCEQFNIDLGGNKEIFK